MLEMEKNIVGTDVNQLVSYSRPTGTGKTMVAKALHAELGNLRLTQTNGKTVNNKLELFSILINADENTTIFIVELEVSKGKILPASANGRLPKAGLLPTNQTSFLYT